MSNFVFEKNIENVRNHRDIRLVITGRKINKFVPEHKCHTTKWFLKNCCQLK